MSSRCTRAVHVDCCRSPYGVDPRRRADRVGQVDDAVRGAQADQRPRRARSSPSRTRSSTGWTGLTQIAVNPRIGLTFAAGLRTILRSDPDVVMVGEIRDPETAEIAVRAALTGHLVLSSIHTNDAPSALTRLTDMGVAAVRHVLGAPRRRRAAARATAVPDACKTPGQRAAGMRSWPLGSRRGRGRRAASRTRPSAAASAANTGYTGRIGVFEVMVMDDEHHARLFLRERALRGAPHGSRSSTGW